MSNVHAKMPALCDDCLACTVAKAEVLDDHILAAPCWHRRIFSLVRVHRGCILSWDLFGPDLSDDQIATKLALVREVAAKTRTPVIEQRGN